MQRDWQVDAGIEPLAEERPSLSASGARGPCRRSSPSSASRAMSEEEVRPRRRPDSRDLPDRDRAADVLAGDRVLDGRISGLDVARALERRGFRGRGGGDLRMQRQRVAADYLQTSAIIDAAAPSSRRSTTQRLPRPRHRLPARGRALGAARRLPYAVDARLLGGGPAADGPRVDGRAGRAGHARGRGRGRRRPGLRRGARRDDRGAAHRDVLDASSRRPRGRREPASCGCAARPTSPSSATTAPGSRARGSRSGCSRRARR